MYLRAVLLVRIDIFVRNDISIRLNQRVLSEDEELDRSPIFLPHLHRVLSDMHEHQDEVMHVGDSKEYYHPNTSYCDPFPTSGLYGLVLLLRQNKSFVNLLWSQ